MSLLATIKSWLKSSTETQNDDNQTTSVEVEEAEETINYSDFRTSELKDMARRRGLKGYSRLNKRELIELIQQTH
jgi:hypothetical protein